MHPCLQTYDIQECICQHLASANSLDALAKLARTCTIFLEPALNALWYAIPGLEPFIKCLPDDAWTIRRNMYYQSVLTLKRQTTPRDWERCKFYAHRIRHYGIEDIDKLDQMKGATQTDKTFYLALRQPFDGFTSAPTPLLTLPNLHSCRLLPYTSDPIPHYSPFLAPTLISLDLRLPSPISVGDTAIISFLRSLPTACPRLQNLSLYGTDVGAVTRPRTFNYDAISGDSEIDGLLTDALHGLQCLESLQCPYIWFPAEAVRHLASRTKLRALSVKNTAESILNALKRDVQHGEKECTRFKHLEDLSVECSPRGGLLEAANLLRHVANATEITTLDVARTGGVPTEIELREFIQVLLDLTVTPHVTRVNSTLKSLHIHQGDETGYLMPADRPIPVSKYTATISTLAPLLQFSNLAELSVVANTRFSLDDDDAYQMARAWPKLRQFELGFCGGDWGREGKTFTLEGLRAFAKHCPDLEELGVSVCVIPTEPTSTAVVVGEQGTEQQQIKGGDDKEVTVADEDGKTRSRCQKLRYLELGDSVYFGDPERVAWCLLDVFPKLSRVYGPSMGVSPEWEKKWMRVSKFVHEMQESRSTKTKTGSSRH